MDNRQLKLHLAADAAQGMGSTAKFTMLGVVAECVGLIYEEVKQRVRFVIKNRIGL